jgi:hypothetical protein
VPVSVSVSVFIPVFIFVLVFVFIVLSSMLDAGCWIRHPPGLGD